MSNGLRGTVGAALESVAGLAAITVGVLYLLGIGTKTRELQHADLPVRDVLPLFPLEQILQSSFTIIWPAVVFFSIVAACLFVSARYERWLSGLSLAFIDGVGDTVPETALSQARREAGRRGDWGKVDEVISAAERVAAQAGQPRPAGARRLRWARGGWDAFGAFLGIGLPVAYLLFPWKIAIPCLVLYALLITYITMRPSPAEREFAILSIIFILGAITYAAVYPRPLAQAVISPGPHSGALVLHADETWYLGVGDGEMTAIPAHKVTRVDIDPQPRKPRALEDVWEWFSG